MNEQEFREYLTAIEDEAEFATFTVHYDGEYHVSERS
jgi:hypothetical protein